MGLSKTTRISLLLAIDLVFFFVELITGNIIGSLALIADAFHMLNDVMSLCVGLWAVRVANKQKNPKTYTYGWQRAETLGALANGVFLVALCFTIFLDAIERFIEPQIITQPRFMLIVGCAGLASNLLGLVLFHDHGHGGHGHSHGGHGDEASAAEEGHAHAHGDPEDRRLADPSGNVEDVLPATRIAGYQSSNTADSDTTAVDASSPLAQKASHGSRSGKSRRHSRSHSRAFSGVEDIPVTPNAFRRSIIDASRLDPRDSEEWEGDEDALGEDTMDTHHHQQQPLLNGNAYAGYGATQAKAQDIDHGEHNHAQPKDEGKGGGGHGHSHGDLNMRGIFLHVMGDALGNIGVIATALFIWLTDYSWRFYFDPAISLLITIIILCSAIPLVKAASRILLQAVPSNIDIDHIKEDIEALPGILSAHHLHVWQLSDTKLVSSLHVQVDFDFKGEGSARYMELVQAIRKCLHEYGIHSSTIQPEFCLDPEHDHSGSQPEDGGSPADAAKRSTMGSRVPSKAGSVCEQACLLECTDECGKKGKGCCDPKPADQEDEGHGHGH
ncbi:Zinc resistance conferring protein [Saxophila tyrrhenica]|uniref:Zinc resistance conferring protein n=1 Tax=Saxophila tyrrhenica TaxID=1690608 RepID=A0AAV9PE72_9PEZI|nr:Zinc resistance conferring protein [Saxophila tyrrhenica]